MGSVEADAMSAPNDSPEAWELFVPGRVCLFGEHTDWAATYPGPDGGPGRPGLALVAGTTQGLYATVTARRIPPGTRPTLTLQATVPADVAPPTSADGSSGESHPERAWPLDDVAVLEADARRGGFFSYAAGAASVVLRRFPGVALRSQRDLRINNHTTTLPVRKGLSSSAAICVLVARALGKAFGLDLTTSDEMELAYLGEIATPSRCGRLDQACAFGPRPSLLEFRGEHLAATPVTVRSPGALHLIVVDLAAGKDTREILRQLNACYPAPRTPIQAAVHRFLGELSPALTCRALAAVEAADAAKLGALMAESQRLFDRDVAPACPRELAAPVLHRLLAHPPLQPLVYGGKGVGSQGDGSAQLVARDAATQEAAIALIERDFPGMRCWPLTLAATND